LGLPDWQIPVVPSWRDERLMDYVLPFNSINFCYWGEPKWTIHLRGRPYNGAHGLWRTGIPAHSGAFLTRISPEQFRRILRGNVLGSLAPAVKHRPRVL
jgi:hypothetical protein